MKKYVACIVILLGCSRAAMAQEEAVVVDGVCARVNQDIITLSTFRRAQQDLRSQLEQEFNGQVPQKEYEAARKGLLQNLIDTQLLVQKADELGINVEADINEYLINLAEQNNVPPSKIDEMLQQMGLDPDQARQLLRVRIMREKVLGTEVYRKISQNIFDEDIETYYKEHLDEFTDPAAVKLSEIFIKFEGRTRQQARSLAEQLGAQIKAGADFVQLAKEHSSGPSASDGGNLGWFNMGPRPELADAPRQAIEGKNAGQITDLVEFPDGFRLYRVDERREKKEKELAGELKRQVSMRIFQQRIPPAVEEYVKQLRKDAYVEALGTCQAEIEVAAKDEKKTPANGSPQP